VEQRDEGYLPPEPSGPEPDLGGGQQQPQQPPQPPPPPQPPRGYSPPYGYGAPGYPPPGLPPQPPGWQPGYTPPGGYYWQPPPPQPDNNPAVGGFVTSAVSAGLCFISSGILSPLTLVGGIVGMVISRKGRQKIESGETTKHKDLATAGFWVGLAAIILSVLAMLAWAAVIVLAATSDSSSDSTQFDFDQSRSSTLRVGLAAARLAVQLVS
jgi:hypothetical protein